jgi:hypothetical protein
MLVTEARYHHDEAVAAGKTVLWRAIPNLGRRPAEVGWSPARFATEALNLVDTAHRPLRQFVWANELDLQTERGDTKDDYSGLEARYGLIGGFAVNLVPILRDVLGPQCEIHFPAFTPDHGALTYVDQWRDAANRHDIIDFHAYDSLDAIQRQYQGYRNAFPDARLALTEWHCRGDVSEETRVLSWLANLSAEDPLLDAAYRFIWRWDNYPGWWNPDFAVEPRPDMVELFLNPPTATPVFPEPAPPQQPDQEAPVPEYQFGFKALADELGEDVVGAPLAGEEPPDAFTFQMTEKGLMVYSKTANSSHFLPAVE